MKLARRTDLLDLFLAHAAKHEMAVEPNKRENGTPCGSLFTPSRSLESVDGELQDESVFIEDEPAEIDEVYENEEN